MGALVGEKLDGSRNFDVSEGELTFTSISVRPDALALLESDLAALGLDALALMRDAGLGAPLGSAGDILEKDVSARHSAEQIVRVYSDAVRVTGDQWLGLRLGAARGVSWLGPLGAALERASTVFAAIDLGCRFVGLLVSGQKLCAEGQGTHYRLTTTLPSGLEVAGARVIQQATVVLMANLIDELVSRVPIPLTLRFACPRPDHRAALDPVRRVGRTLVFDADLWSLELPRSCLGLRPNAEEEEAHGALVSQLEAELRRLEASQDLQSRLRHQLLLGLAQPPRLGSMARSLGMSSRALQLGLAKRKTSFQQELAQVRLDVARRFLRGTDEPVTVIAALVGFRSVEAFSRFFRALDGRSPRAHRAQTAGARRRSG